MKNYIGIDISKSSIDVYDGKKVINLRTMKMDLERLFY